MTEDRQVPVTDEMLGSMRQNAATLLYSLQTVSGRQRLKDLVRKLAGRGTEPHDAIFWPASLLMIGLFESGDTDTPAAYLDRWYKAGAPFRKVDDALAGYVMTELAAAGNERFMGYAGIIADALQKCPADEAGSYIYGGGLRNRYIFADGAGMTSLFLIRYGSIVRDEHLIRSGITQIGNFLTHGMDEATGLPYHGYDLESGICHGIIGWGRAAGWLLMGMQACLQPEACAPDVVTEAVYAMIRSVLAFQRPDGLFSWQLETLRGPADTSAAGMIVWSLLKALQSGDMPDDLAEQITEAVRKALPALAACVHDGRAGGALAECIDFAQYRQEYGYYPWGQGAVLMALAAACGGAPWENGR